MEQNAFTFFPGKGVYTTPNAGLDPVLSIYEREEVELVFSAFSLLATGHSPIVLSKKFKARTIRNARKLLAVHGAVQHRANMALPTHPTISFDGGVVSSGTRVSFRTNDISWQDVEDRLNAQGYHLKKRSYLHGALDDLVPVYVVAHKETGVISEGKGLTDKQAKYSALAEAIERMYALPTDPARIIVDSHAHLFAKKKTDLHILSGPRDTFSNQMVTEWVPAIDLLNNESVYLPAELAYFRYVPQFIKVKLFSLHHTTGLATGSSIEEATLNGLFEILERDAYWITMRCKLLLPDIELHSIQNLDPKILEILKVLKKQGFEVVVKDMSLDWGVPIAHATLVDTKKRIPAFAHGSGAAFDWPTAIARAVAEVIQMHSGMTEFTNIPGNWERIVSAGDVLGRGELAWSDPLFAPHIHHLTARSGKTYTPYFAVTTPSELLASMQKRGYSVVAARLHEVAGLELVRVYIPEATQPDERVERVSKRMESFRLQEKLRAFYCDPILT
jgi:thiazole/oxazole-forming peptide maturase SagD family component